MKDYICIDNKKIEISDETTKRIKEQLGEKTYGIGQFFQGRAGAKYILAFVDNRVALVDLNDGIQIFGSRPVDNVHEIPQTVIDELFTHKLWKVRNKSDVLK